MRFRLIPTDPLPDDAIWPGFLACCGFLLAILAGELVLRTGLHSTNDSLVVGGVLIVLGLIVGIKVYKPPRHTIFMRRIVIAALPPIVWLLLTAYIDRSAGFAAVATFVLCLILIMVSVFRAPVVGYFGLGLAIYGLFWIFIRDPIASGQWTGGIVMAGLALSLASRRLMAFARASRVIERRPFRLAQSDYLNADACRSGFLACSSFLVMIIAGQLALRNQAPAPLMLVVELAALPILGILLGMARYLHPRSALFWKGIFTVALAGIAWLSWLVWLGWPLELGSTVSLGVTILFVMIAIFRAPLFWYAMLPLTLAAVVAVSTHDVSITVFVALVLGALLAVLNYGVQLVLDHEREIRRLALNDAPSFEIAGRSAFVLLMPALVLVILGSALNYCLQSWLIQMPYAESSLLGGNVPVVHRDCRNGPKGIDELERDLACSIDYWESNLRTEADLYVTEASSEVKGLSNQAPDVVAEQVMRLRPPTIDGDNACRGFQKSYKVFRGSITVSFTSPCKTLIKYVNEALTRSHARMARAINGSLTAADAKVTSVIAGHTEQFRRDVASEIHASADRVRDANRQIFVGLRILQIVSWVLLVVSLVAAYQMLLGRIFFDLSTAKSLTFRLARHHQLVQPLAMTPHHVLDLDADLPKATSKKDNATRWFVSLNMSRKGHGTSMNAVVGSPGVAALQRMLAGNYVTTAVDVVPLSSSMNNVLQTSSSSNGPQLSIAGDHRLVRIELKAGQRVGFRVADLVAWTDRVELRSRYTTHIGANLLGLGSFCIVAEGAQADDSIQGRGASGYIVLRSEGVTVSASAIDTSTPISNLLAWDESHEFALAQQLHPWKVWINEPSVVTKSIAGAVILDEGSPGKWPLLSRVGNLLRYFLLPI